MQIIRCITFGQQIKAVQKGTCIPETAIGTKFGAARRKFNLRLLSGCLIPIGSAMFSATFYLVACVGLNALTILVIGILSEAQNFVYSGQYDFVQISPACCTYQTYQIMYEEILDFQCQFCNGSPKKF